MAPSTNLIQPRWITFFPFSSDERMELCDGLAYRQPPIQLAGGRAFCDVPEVSSNIGAIIPESAAATLAAHHCAGLSHCPDGRATLAYLLGETEGLRQWMRRSDRF